MSNKEEADFIKQCLSQIERDLGWGKSDDWSNNDFEKLSELIYEKTSVRLSPTTIKRVWGRIKYEHDPTTTTLNTLAQFAGHENWRTFRQKSGNQPLEKEDKRSHKSKLARTFWLAIPVLMIVALFIFSPSFLKSSKSSPANFAFRANKVISEGVPNSVIFEYNAASAKTDSVFIAQSWDVARKKLVPKNGTHHSSIYYIPGYFNAKLFADGEMVKVHDLQITTAGWLAMMETMEKPFYFTKKDITKGGGVEVDEELLKKNEISLKPKAPGIVFFNHKDFGSLRDDNFIFETQVRNSFRDGNNACQKMEIYIECKHDILMIPLCASACIGEINLHVAGKDINSEMSDMSGFGTDLSQWTSLKVVSKKKLVTIFVNGHKASSFSFPNPPADIVGLQYRFNGTGGIRNTSIKNDKLSFDL